METKLLDVKRAADFLSISVPKLRLLMATGDISFVRIGRRTLLKAETLSEFVEKNTIKSKAS